MHCFYCKMRRKVVALTLFGWREMCNRHWLKMAKNLNGIRVHVSS